MPLCVTCQHVTCIPLPHVSHTDDHLWLQKRREVLRSLAGATGPCCCRAFLWLYNWINCQSCWNTFTETDTHAHTHAAHDTHTHCTRHRNTPTHIHTCTHTLHTTHLHTFTHTHTHTHNAHTSHTADRGSSKWVNIPFYNRRPRFLVTIIMNYW